MSKKKEFRVFASQLVYYYKDIKANSEEEAEELAFEADDGSGWKDYEFGEWQIEEGTRENKNA
jgi:hypothetical protein